MTRSIFIIACLAVFLIFCNCRNANKEYLQSEAVERISTFWVKNNNVDSPIIIIERAWQQDSVGITQICGIITTGTDNERSTKIQTIGYRLVDLRNQWAYEYTNFSDTATVVRKYSYTDTTLMVGGWNFGNHKPIDIKEFRLLSDTTVKSSILKQARVRFNFNGAFFEGNCLFDCQRKGTFFELDTGISKRAGCPLVFLSTYPVSDIHSKYEEEVKLVTHNFADSVNNVFNAWRQNEYKLPVK